MESKNISNRILSQIYLGINILGILLSLLYGVTGGSGGETTEGVFLGFFYTSILSVIFLIIITFIRLSWWKLNLTWAFLPFIIYGPIDKIILGNKFETLFKSESVQLGTVSKEKYQKDFDRAKKQLELSNKKRFSLDTIIYSADTKQQIIICTNSDTNNNTIHYMNHELFFDTIYREAHGGNLAAVDTDKKRLINSVIKYYTTSFSSSEDDSDYLWSYPDIWK